MSIKYVLAHRKDPNNVGDIAANPLQYFLSPDQYQTIDVAHPGQEDYPGDVPVVVGGGGLIGNDFMGNVVANYLLSPDEMQLKQLSEVRWKLISEHNWHIHRNFKNKYSELIEEAKTRLDERKVKMDRLLNELQREKTYLERLNKEHIDAQRIADEARLDYLEKKSRYEERLQVQQENSEKNNRYLNAGKKMLGFIDRYTTRSRKKDINLALLEEVRKYLAMEKSKIEDQQTSEKLKAQALSLKPKKKKVQKPEEDPHQRHKIIIGSTVRLIATKQNGTVENLDGEQVTVSFGFLRMKVEKEKLSWVK